jgi:hypothetical protein
MTSINTLGTSNASGVSGPESKIETASEHNIGPRSVVWLSSAIMVGLAASITMEHLLLPHLARWHYQVMTIPAVTAATGICGYYPSRKIRKLFSTRIQIEKRLALERNLNV